VKKSGVFHHQLAAVIATMGHGDQLVVADAGLPVPPGVERIDLAVTAGLPGMLAVTTAVAAELQVERVIYATELEPVNPELVAALRRLFPEAAFEFVPHEEFKRITGRVRAVVRTGECSPYANVILTSGVTF
jgi:D-ribose pyranase